MHTHMGCCTLTPTVCAYRCGTSRAAFSLPRVSTAINTQCVHMQVKCQKVDEVSKYDQGRSSQAGASMPNDGLHPPPAHPRSLKETLCAAPMYTHVYAGVELSHDTILMGHTAANIPRVYVHVTTSQMTTSSCQVDAAMSSNVLQHAAPLPQAHTTKCTHTDKHIVSVPIHTQCELTAGNIHGGNNP